MLKLIDAIKEFTKLRKQAAVIAGPGAISGVLYAEDTSKATIYNMELGYPTSICLGLALATPNQPVVAIEGDGSMVAGISSLSTVARYGPKNLIVIVLNNGVYGTTGDGETETAAGTCMNIPDVAVASGFDPDYVKVIDDIYGLHSALELAMATPGPWLVCISIEREAGGAKCNYPIPRRDVVEAAIGFRREMIERGYALKVNDETPP